MKKSTLELIDDACRAAQTGDFGITRGTGFYSRSIRVMTGRGLHKPWGNHNFPIWTDPSTAKMMILNIAPPAATIMPLAEYLFDLYKGGGKCIICRPDAFTDLTRYPLAQVEGAFRYLYEEWLKMRGVVYDKASIWQIAKLYFRIRKHIPDNDKSQVYCTEGTFAPYASNPRVAWKPDCIAGEMYPVPIHSEHLIRQKRVVFVAGDVSAWNQIMVS